MVMKLYGIGTMNVQRAILPFFDTEVDAEKELELVKVSLRDGHHLLPIFTQKQPFGQIPYFEDGEITTFGKQVSNYSEHARIIPRVHLYAMSLENPEPTAGYLAEKYEGQGSNLLSKTAQERAAVHQWTETEAHSFTATSDPLIRELRHAEILQRPVNEEILKRSEPRFNQVLDIYEPHLSSRGTKYLAGEEHSLAEIFHTANVHWLLLHRPDFFATRPCELTWAKDITTRPSFMKSLQMVCERGPLLQ